MQPSIRSNFESYLEKYDNVIEAIQYQRTYIRLVLMFKETLSAKQLEVALELQKKLYGEKYCQISIDELLELSNQNLRNNISMTQTGALNQLLFGAFLDTKETDVHYVTEPIFIFVSIMDVSPSELKEILESEFIGLKI